MNTRKKQGQDWQCWTEWYVNTYGFAVDRLSFFLIILLEKWGAEWTGTLVFKKARIISKYDIDNQMIEAGDQLVGRRRNGEIQAGRFLSANGKFKYTVIIGGD